MATNKRTAFALYTEIKSLNEAALTAFVHSVSVIIHCSRPYAGSDSRMGTQSELDPGRLTVEWERCAECESERELGRKRMRQIHTHTMQFHAESKMAKPKKKNAYDAGQNDRIGST